jgi:hypothetical protein
MIQGLASYLTLFVLDSQICLFDTKPLSFSLVSLLNLLHIYKNGKNALSFIQRQCQAQDANYAHQGDNEEKIIS